MVNRSETKQNASVTDYSPAAMTVFRRSREEERRFRIAAAKDPNQPGAGGG